jgi:hypothetical protein
LKKGTFTAVRYYIIKWDAEVDSYVMQTYPKYKYTLGYPPSSKTHKTFTSFYYSDFKSGKLNQEQSDTMSAMSKVVSRYKDERLSDFEDFSTGYFYVV